MALMWSDAIPWNIFARELEGVLQTRDLRLGHLDDRAVVSHPEKVRRLQKSLKTPAHFPVLNPDELDRLTRLISLSDEEQSRLRAALVATAVERALMDRLDPPTALMAANDVFEICLAAMREQPTMALATVKAGAIVARIDPEEVAGAAEVLDLLDTATSALDTASNASSLPARQANAWVAEMLFTRAIHLLKNEGAGAENDGAWRSRLDEAREGHALAEALLRPGEAE
jgi:hypothetical protein